ncbi:hypothetical protein DL768_009445 [Monosporascus sp. mg162]|nr:hypothetical protein DL768_009445 [Monosporascus sp. mg162]
MRTKRSLAAIQFFLCHVILGHIALVHAQYASGVSPASLRGVHENSDVSQRGDGEIMVKMASGLHKEKDVEFDAQDHEVDSDFTAIREKRSPRRNGGGSSGGSSGNSTAEDDSAEDDSAGTAVGSPGFVVSFATALSVCLAIGLLGV